jgi:hypothetical protein
MKEPVPTGTTQTLDFCVQLLGMGVKASTQVEFAGEGGPGVQLLTATRVTSGPPVAVVTSLASGCAGQLDLWPDAPGSPHSAGASSDLPVIGNSSFGVRVLGTAPDIYVLGFDVETDPLVFAGCTIWLGLTSALGSKAGVLPAGGAAFIKTPIPDQPAVLGVDVVLQAVFVDAEGLSGLSNAIGVVIGSCP